jgi:TetR/AcrR family transcriptional repressor of nem operon
MMIVIGCQFACDHQSVIPRKMDRNCMRVSKQEAARTRERIIAAAAVEFRRKGIAGAGLSDLMSAAGLTHGGFYRHFESKDELIAEACAAAIDSVATMYAAAPNSGRNELKTIAARYLSEITEMVGPRGVRLPPSAANLHERMGAPARSRQNGYSKSLIRLRDTSRERDLTSRDGKHWSRSRQWSER